MKPVMFPVLLYTLIMYKWTRSKSNNLIYAKLIHYLVAFFFIIGVFYLYTAIIGHHELIIDIILFIIGITTGAIISHKIQNRRPLDPFLSFFAMVILLLLILLTILWTYNPPEVHLFMDGNTDPGKYGSIIGHGH